MSWNEGKHQDMRKWAAMPGVDVNDPENLIFRDGKPEMSGSKAGAA